MNDECIIFPGHGAGSPCGKKIQSALYSTVGKEKKDNYAMQIDNKEEFHQKMTENLTPPP